MEKKKRKKLTCLKICGFWSFPTLKKVPNSLIAAKLVVVYILVL